MSPSPTQKLFQNMVICETCTHLCCHGWVEKSNTNGPATLLPHPLPLILPPKDYKLERRMYVLWVWLLYRSLC